MLRLIQSNAHPSMQRSPEHIAFPSQTTKKETSPPFSVSPSPKKGKKASTHRFPNFVGSPCKKAEKERSPVGRVCLGGRETGEIMRKFLTSHLRRTGGGVEGGGGESVSFAMVLLLLRTSNTRENRDGQQPIQLGLAHPPPPIRQVLRQGGRRIPPRK